MNITKYNDQLDHFASTGDGYSTAEVVHDGSCTLLMVSGLIDAAGDEKFLQVFDSDSLPTDGDNPVMSIPISPTASSAGYFRVDLPLHGLRLANGLVVASSEHPALFTEDSSDTMRIEALYVT